LRNFSQQTQRPIDSVESFPYLIKNDSIYGDHMADHDLRTCSHVEHPALTAPRDIARPHA
jgi:hypothetical protein